MAPSFLRQIAYFLFVLLLLGNSQAFAESVLFNDLAGTWDDLDSFVTEGGCAGSPSSIGLYMCNPALLAYAPSRFEASAFLSGTDSVLAVADTLRQQQLDATDINALFASYNYSDLLVSGRLDYVTKGFIMGVRPVRLQGQFEVHNPNLPLGSLTYREDLEFFTGGAFAFKWDGLNIALGVQATLLRRKEILTEASLVDLTTESSAQLLNTQIEYGAFADIGSYIELPNVFTASAIFHDAGGFFNGTDLTSQYLYIRKDRFPRVAETLAWTPKLWVGTLQLGAGLEQYVNDTNVLNQQWIASAGYFLGPFRISGCWRPDLFRTGLGLRIGLAEMSVAQEWNNQLRDGRTAQPRFILQASAGL